jgi:alcohol dehydrogenase class IV
MRPYLIANVAIDDPELTLGMPPLFTAGTGLDALTHNIGSISAEGLSLDVRCHRAVRSTIGLFEPALLKEMGIPDRLTVLGITREMVPELSKKAMEDACHLLNLRPCTQKDMTALYERAL